MPTVPYYVDGKRVPSTTGITGRWKESGGLINWAWQCGVDGKDYRKERDKAADAGTLVHAMVEAHASGTELPDILNQFETKHPPEIFEPALVGFGAYMEWVEQTKLEVVEQEIHLVSTEYRYGGTPDAIGYCNSKLALLDWKTGRFYPDHLLQLAAYRQLLHENRPDDKLESFHLLRFGREHGQFVHYSWPKAVIDEAWESFVLMRELYDRDKKLKAIAK